MARIGPADSFQETLKERNTYTTRLYGIPKQASTVLLFQELKHSKAKTCYIPTCSTSGKRRGFAIIGFENQTDLETACNTSVRYQHRKLSWSQSRRQTLVHNDKTKNTSSTWYNRASEQGHTSHSSAMSIISSTSTVSQSEVKYITKQDRPNHIKKQGKMNKGKEKAISNITGNEYVDKATDNTTNKLISLITRMAARLDDLEEKLGPLPNRS